jgi:hypothetical protein
MLREMSDTFQLWPIPEHKGISIEKSVLKILDPNNIKDLILRKSNQPFQEVNNQVSIQLLGEYDNDTIWFIRIQNKTYVCYQVILGSSI